MSNFSDIIKKYRPNIESEVTAGLTIPDTYSAPILPPGETIEGALSAPIVKGYLEAISQEVNPSQYFDGKTIHIGDKAYPIKDVKLNAIRNEAKAGTVDYTNATKQYTETIAAAGSALTILRLTGRLLSETTIALLTKAFFSGLDSYIKLRANLTGAGNTDSTVVVGDQLYRIRTPGVSKEMEIQKYANENEKVKKQIDQAINKEKIGNKPIGSEPFVDVPNFNTNVPVSSYRLTKEDTTTYSIDNTNTLKYFPSDYGTQDTGEGSRAIKTNFLEWSGTQFALTNSWLFELQIPKGINASTKSMNTNIFTTNVSLPFAKIVWGATKYGYQYPENIELEKEFSIEYYDTEDLLITQAIRGWQINIVNMKADDTLKAYYFAFNWYEENFGVVAVAHLYHGKFTGEAVLNKDGSITSIKSFFQETQHWELFDVKPIGIDQIAVATDDGGPLKFSASFAVSRIGINPPVDSGTPAASPEPISTPPTIAPNLPVIKPGLFKL